MKAARHAPLTILLATLLHAASGAALESAAPPGAEAAALDDKATALEQDVDKACQKVPQAARQLCHAQYAQAAQRLRAQAARKR